MGCTPAACCATVFISVIVIIAFIIIAIEDRINSSDDGYYSGGSGVGYGRYRGFRGGGWGRGGGFGRGCFSDNTMVWTKREEEDDKYAKEIMIKDLKEGDLVGTIDLSNTEKETYRFMWTRVTDVTLYSGNWTTHTFVFPNAIRLKATSPHLMVITRNRVSYFIRADNVRIGDEMIVNGTMALVIDIQIHMITRKVSIETEDGTVQVNGVLASGICDNNPEVVNRIVDYRSFIKDYKTRHFGVEYNHMCMDSVAWKNAYMMNNGYLK